MRQSQLERKFEKFAAKYSLSYLRYDLPLPRCGRRRPDYKHICRENCIIDLYHPIYHSFDEAIGRIAPARGDRLTLCARNEEETDVGL